MSIARILYQTYFCLLGSCFLTLSIISVVCFNSSLREYELIIENWKQDPIQSMRVTYDICSPDEESVFNYNWPGTKDGCDCRNIFRVLTQTQHNFFVPSRKIYNNHACNITQEIYGCTSIYAVHSRKFRLFPVPSGEYGYEICVKRKQGNSFYENPPQQPHCPSGQKQCGTHLDNFICVSGDECPILSYSIETSANQVNDNQTIQMKSGYQLKINRNNDQNPIISQITVSEGGVCIDYHDTAISEGRSDYILMKQMRKACDKDDRFKQLYSVSEFDFYKVNEALDLESMLPGYQISEQYRWGIYNRGYILWRMGCRGQILEDFKSSEKQLNKIYDSQIYLLICSIIFFVVISVFLSIVQGLNLYGFDWPCIKGQDAEESNYIFYMEIFCKIIISTITAIIILKTYSEINTELNLYDDIIPRQCTDNFTQHQIIEMRDTLKTVVYNFDLTYLILFILTTILDCCVASYFTVTYYKEKRDYQYQIDERNRRENQYQIDEGNNRDNQQIELPQLYNFSDLNKYQTQNNNIFT